MDADTNGTIAAVDRAINRSKYRMSGTLPRLAIENHITASIHSYFNSISPNMGDAYSTNYR